MSCGRNTQKEDWEMSCPYMADIAMAAATLCTASTSRDPLVCNVHLRFGVHIEIFWGFEQTLKHFMYFPSLNRMVIERGVSFEGLLEHPSSTMSIITISCKC